jgi:hypothetical protein
MKTTKKQTTMKKVDKEKRMFPTCWQGFRMGGGSQPVTNFPSIVAKFIVTTMYEQWMELHGVFPKDTYVIIDGSSGWSGRMVGILGSYTDLRNRYRQETGRELTICYLTTDPHKRIDYRFPLIVDDWFTQVEPEVDRNYFQLHKAKVGSETKRFYNFCKQKMEEFGVDGGQLSLTSPPYFNREKYSKDLGQCCEKFKNYESYRDGFLRLSIQNIYDLLLPTGKFFFNIADLKDGKKVHPLQKNSTDFAVESGFRWISTYKMLLKSSGKGCINRVIIKGKPRKYEPIFVLEK